MTTIPSYTDELTPAWFGEVLETDVRSVELVDAHSGTTGRALVRIDGDGLPDTLFVKLQPFPEEQRSFLRMTGLGVAEARFYAGAGTLPVRAPRPWYAAHEDETGSFIMILEDLVASGCRFATPEDDDVLAVAESLMDELAVLHATYWEQDLPWLGSHTLSSGGGGGQQRQRAAGGATLVQSALDQFAAEMPPAFGELASLCVERFLDIGRLFTQGEKTLVHGDDHIGNLFVDGGRTGFYDWAVASRYAGMRDVAYFLCNSLPTALRRDEEVSLISRYRQGLADRGITLDERTAWDQYRLFATYSWISASTTLAMGSRLQPYEVGHRGTVLTTEAISDLDTIGLLRERLA
jgi:hypothetical protein